MRLFKLFVFLVLALAACGGTDDVFSSVPNSTGGETSVGGSGGSNEGGQDPGPVPCDGECSLDNAFATCLNNECVIESCLDGYENCNGWSIDGCEVKTSSDPLSCGSCTNQCFTEGAVSVCSGGSCGCALDDNSKCLCEEGLGDCDTSRDNGCESDLTSPASCGTCGNVCTGSAACVDGNCECQSLGNNNQIAGSCGTCLEQSCCSEIDACLADPNCSSKFGVWINCHNNSSSPTCQWFCEDFSNANYNALRACYLNASQVNGECGCGYHCGGG